MRKFTKRSVALISAGVVAVGGAGAAYAAWLLSGEGSAQASSAEAADLQVASVQVQPAFFPGSTNDLSFTVTNPNPFPVLITGITPTIASTNTTACPNTNVIYNAGAQPSPSSVLALSAADANATTDTATITYEDALSMIANAADGCQGVPFDIEITVNASSNAS
jgi:hypothetical protein